MKKACAAAIITFISAISLPALECEEDDHCGEGETCVNGQCVGKAAETDGKGSSDAPNQPMYEPVHGAVFTLSGGINFAVGENVSGVFNPGVNLCGDLVGELKPGTEFKLGIGGFSDYTLFSYKSDGGVFGVYTIGPILKPVFRLGNKVFSISEIGGGYSLKHWSGREPSGTNHAFGFIVGTGISIARFIFGAKYRIAVDEAYGDKWVTAYIGVLLWRLVGNIFSKQSP